MAKGDVARRRGGGLSAYAWQLYALMYKNVMLARRNWISTAVHLLAPAVFVLIFAAVLAASNAENVDRNPAALAQLGSADKMPRCVVFDKFGGRFGQGRVIPNYPCLTVVFAPDSAEVTAVMSRMAALNGLDFGNDFLGFPSEAAMESFVDVGSTPVLAALKFPDDGTLLETVATSLSNAEEAASSPTSDVVPFEIWYNKTIMDGQLLSKAGKDNIELETGLVSSYVLQVQRAVSEAILAQHTGSAATKLDVNIRPFAFLSGSTAASESQSESFFAVESFGALFYVVGIMLSFIVTLRQIVAEKDLKILDGLRQMGLYESCYWLSWFLTYAVLMLFSSLIMVVAGVASGIAVFVHTDFLWMWIVLYLYLLSMATLAMALSTVLPNTRTAVMSGFFLMVVGVLFQMFVSFRVIDIVALLYNPWEVSSVALGLLNLYPPLVYAKIDNSMAGHTLARPLEDASGTSTTVTRDYGFADAADGSYQHMSPFRAPDPALDGAALCSNVTARGFAACYVNQEFDCYDQSATFTYDPASDLSLSIGSKCVQQACTQDFMMQATRAECDAAGARFFPYRSGPGAVLVSLCLCQYTLPSDADSVLLLLGLMVLYMAVAWYVGQVVTFGHGRAEPIWFPLLPQYWVPALKTTAGVGGGGGGAQPRPRKGAEDDDVAAERQRVESGACNDPAEFPIVMRALVKDYGGGVGECGKPGFRAVDGMTLALRRGELLALLGKNGCGKSTLCNMLTGMISVSGGACTINGMDIKTSLSQVKHAVSVCPQFDILFAELSAREHVRFYGHFKGLSRAEVQAEAEPLLKTVRLDKLKRPAGNYSGGMRRRLSIVVAAIGAPGVLILDEPTTGLDPHNARHVWEVIERVKRDRVVILTTHMLEEADALGDRVAIMNNGALVAIGDALHLKRKFGGAYRVSFSAVDEADRAALNSDVRKRLPGAEPDSANLDPQSGPMVFSVPEAHLDSVPDLFRWVEKQVDTGRVKDVGLLQTSLEDVFLTLDAAERKAERGAALAAGAESSKALAPDPEAQAAGGDMHFSAGASAVRFSPSFGKQVRGLFRKSLVLQLRQRKTVCCQLFIPLLMIGLMALIKFFIETSLGSDDNGSRDRDQAFLDCISCVSDTSRQVFDFANSNPASTPVSDYFFGDPLNVNAADAADAQTLYNDFLSNGFNYFDFDDFEARFPLDADDWMSPGFPPYDICLASFACAAFDAARLSTSTSVVEAPAWTSPFMAPERVTLNVYDDLRSSLGGSVRVMVGAVSAALRTALGQRCDGDGLLSVVARTNDNVLEGTGCSSDALGESFGSDEVRPQVPQGADGTLSALPEFGNCAFGDDAAALGTEGLAAAFTGSPGTGFLQNWPRRIVQMSTVSEPLNNVTNFFSPALCPLSSYGTFAALSAGLQASADPGRAINEIILEGQQAVRDGRGFGARLFERSEAGVAAARAALDENFPNAGLVFRALDPATARAEVDIMVYLRPSGTDDECSFGTSVYANAHVELVPQSGSNAGSCDNSKRLTPPSVYMGLEALGGSTSVKTVDASSFVLSGLASALLRAATPGAGSPLAGAVDPMFTTGVKPMPYPRDQASQVDTEEILAALNKQMALIMVPLATSFLLPVLVFHIVHERELKLRATMQMMGLRMKAYWTVQYLFDLTLTGTTLLLVYVLCLALDIFIVAAHEFGVVLILFLLWAHSLIAQAFFLSTFFSRTRNANIALYLLVFASVIASLVVNLVVFDPRPFEPAPAWWVMWPQFTFYRCLYLMATRSYFWEDMGAGDELAGLLGVMALQSVLLVLAFLYLDNVVPREFGTNRGPFFCVTDVWRALTRGGRAARVAGKGADDAEDEDGEDLDAESGETSEEDPDVAEERRLLRGNAVELLDAPVRVLGLRKRFGSLVAVNNIYLHAGDAMCLGILGPNGSGKSTMFGMLTGLFGPTSGTAVVNGHDIRTEMERVHENIGVCPQHDVTYASLTVAEHLLLYARLKGVPRSQEREVLKTTLDSVELGPFAQRQAGQLSGGQRRRLSIAISFIGDPAVVYLDEPTTGIDAGTKLAIEALILAEKKKRTILCTTHAMPEATKLSDRIAILVHGKLRTIGTSNSLTTKFSQGFKLQTVVTDRDVAVEFVRARFPGAAVETEVNAKVVFRFDAAVSVSVADVFEVMRAESQQNGVADFGVRMTSLEEVFIRLAEESEAAFGTA